MTTTDDRCGGRPGRLLALALVALAAVGARMALGAPPDREGTEFFESKIRPLLVARCYECHSHKAAKLAGGLALDSKAGWEAGGDGGPAIVPGRPGESRLIKAVQWTDDEVHMPPKKKLSATEVALLIEWVRRGAPDPRQQTAKPAAPANGSWEAVFRERLNWWSLRPVGRPRPPDVKHTEWCRDDLDRFVLAALEKNGLAPAPQADRRTLARRLSFALTGLPPDPQWVERFVSDPRPDAYEARIDELLASPHFGERWARRWMDVVHYSDTHGYEWDIPAKNGWRYRDYLIRAFNGDVSYRQLVLEHLAGDLLDPPRIDPQANINESLIGPMALRLGERRHGDNSEFDGITQEAIDNVVDTVGKTFLSTTVACAHCHDHKLDALAQRDYYAWVGVFMSSRWVTRSVNARDPNEQAIAELRVLKERLRPALAEIWLRSLRANRIAPPWTTPASERHLSLENPAHVWAALEQSLARGKTTAEGWQELAAEYAAGRAARQRANARNLRLLADFTRETIPDGWSVDGLGAKNGLARDGDFAIFERGDAVIRHVLPAGLYTHLYSTRLEGAVRSPLWTHGETLISLGLVGGGFAAAHPIVDHALFPERAEYLDFPFPASLVTHTRLLPAVKDRRVYFELATLGLNNNYPARVGVMKGTPDGRSWFGVTRVYAGGQFQDELGRFERLFSGPIPHSPAEAADRIRRWLGAAIERWGKNRADGQDAALIDWMLERRLLPNDVHASAALPELISRYRLIQERIVPDVTVGSIADAKEGRDERIGVRGSYSDLGEVVPRGNIRFLAAISARPRGRESGRLELARCLADPENPLTARVYVNRVWQALFGAGLVRTTDDFGHLGETPSNPELLDHLARRFIDGGWSTKKLVRACLASATWQQSGMASPGATAVDPENRLCHHMPLRRLEAEEIRDAVLAVAGRLDCGCYGPPIDPFRRSHDEMKRLFSGPVDGNGRRSVYIKMTMMEPPKFLAEFNQPLPKLTAGRRDVTNVPTQALTLLNDPFLANQSEFWARHVATDGKTTAGARVEQMLARALGRPAAPDERARFERFVDRVAELRGVRPADVPHCVPVWRDVAHAIFNLKEFIYVR